MANTFKEVCAELALANRMVANEGVIDAFGHVSMRHPDNPGRYLLSRSRAPELVTPEDVVEYDLDSRPLREVLAATAAQGASLPLEGIYAIAAASAGEDFRS